MKYTSEDINILIESIKDYKRLQGVINSYKESGASYDRLMLDLKHLSGFSISNDLDENFLDFYYEDMILTLHVESEKDINYYLNGGIQLINKNGYCIGDFNNVEDMEKVFHDYVWSRIEIYVDNSDCEELESMYDWFNVKVGDKEDLKQTMFTSYWSGTGEDKDIKKKVDLLDARLNKQENSRDKVYTSYDVECMIFLSLQIMKHLDLDKQLHNFFIDLYHEEIVKIYEDYKKHDDMNNSLLDSINNYIIDNEETLKNRIKKAMGETF